MPGKKKESGPEKTSMRREIARLHKEACDRGDMTYRDPATGNLVFTAVSHLERGHCCSSGCRHCPY